MSRSSPVRLEVLHRVPGRVRLAVEPAELALLSYLAAQAPRVVGVTTAELGASRRNLVVRFDPGCVSEDNLLLRLALALSARLAYAPVQLMRERRPRGLDRGAAISGGLAATAALWTALSPAGAAAVALGWAAALLTVASIGRSVAAELGRGQPRPEGLALLHLMSRLGRPDRSYSALLTWLLYHGQDLAEQTRGGAARGVELRPVRLKSGVREDLEGTHIEILTRPVQTRGRLEGSLLTPATLATAAIGYLAYSLQQGWIGPRSNR